MMLMITDYAILCLLPATLPPPCLTLRYADRRSLYCFIDAAPLRRFVYACYFAAYYASRQPLFIIYRDIIARQLMPPLRPPSEMAAVTAGFAAITLRR